MEAPKVDPNDVGYSDDPTRQVIRPDREEDVNDFMRFITEECDLDELED